MMRLPTSTHQPINPSTHQPINPSTHQPKTLTDMKTNKYIYLHVLQGDYGHGWDDLTASESLKEIRQDRRDHEANECASFRIIKRREDNPEYTDITDIADTTAAGYTA